MITSKLAKYTKKLRLYKLNCVIYELHLRKAVKKHKQVRF